MSKGTRVRDEEGNEGVLSDQDLLGRFWVIYDNEELNCYAQSHPIPLDELEIISE